MTIIVLVAALSLAFVNGANDNTKGVATLVGSGVVPYRGALALATAATALGSVVSVFLAGRLISAFSGKGLVPEAALTPPFLAAVTLSAAATVLLATRLRMPVSTTHAILGGLAGAGLVTAGSAFNGRAALTAFALPLAAGPVLAIAAALVALRAGRRIRRRLGVGSNPCVCVGNTWVPVSSAAHARNAVAAAAVPALSVTVGDAEQCRQRYVGRVVGLDAHRAVEGLHVLSGMLVSFARGLNDTPKIVGLALAVTSIAPSHLALAAALMMALGGIVAARPVTETLTTRITPMTTGRGLAANLATSFLVAGASPLGLPLSTTHVSAGSILGIGGAGGTLRWKTTTEVLAAWLATLPVAFVLGAVLMRLLA